MLSDVTLFSGVKILFRVGLVLLKCMLGSQEKLKACQGLYETMERLRAIQPQYMQETFLVNEVQLYNHCCNLCYPFYCYDPAPAALSVFPLDVRFFSLTLPSVAIVMAIKKNNDLRLNLSQPTIYR